MSDFPDSLFTPREVENREGVEYDAEKTKVFFAEDHNKATAEIVAIQEIFGLNPEGDFTTVDDRISNIEAKSNFVNGGGVYSVTLGAVTVSNYVALPDRLGNEIDGDKAYFIAVVFLSVYGTSVSDVTGLYLVRWRGSSTKTINSIYTGSNAKAPILSNNGGVLSVNLLSETNAYAVSCAVLCSYDSDL